MNLEVNFRFEIAGEKLAGENGTDGLCVIPVRRLFTVISGVC